MSEIVGQFWEQCVAVYSNDAVRTIYPDFVGVIAIVGRSASVAART